MRHRSSALFCGTDVATFSITMLVLVLTLLVIEMTIPQPIHDGLVAHLPKVSHPVSMWRARKWDALVVVILRDGKVSLGGDVLLPVDLSPKIREALSRGAENRVYIKADARVRYGAVKPVLDAVRASGIENVAFLADQRKETTNLATTKQ